ncbi:PorP/SprF family type IX secretion system membrane protein [Sediminitomix flava]|uniref:PorP/SprF family type IX secretion system membrane protein n=1 Tax=Sediminitomix flava TaxID=379075 RepID=UPI001304879C|nr:type IX secretion system membrane protein PorP/SprF [Sediminitomix flava]
MLKILLSLLCYFQKVEVCAQDVQLTQANASPLYLNPALTGSNYDMRAAVSYRNQWVGLPANFQTYLASFDYFHEKSRMSVGSLIIQDQRFDSGNKRLTELSLISSASYLLEINKDLHLSVGLQVGVIQGSLDFYGFIFSDQLDDKGITGPSLENLPSTNVFNPDVNAGILLFNKQYWFGFSAYHLTTPNISFLSEGGITKPIRYNLNAGYVIPLKYNKRYGVPNLKNYNVTVTGLYQREGNAQQFTIGGYYTNMPIIVGFWYRGMPFLKNASDYEQINHDAVAFLFGLRVKKFQFGYSFDYSLSKLPSGQSLSHEISLAYPLHSYDENPKKPKKKKTKVICPLPTI